MIEGKPSCVTDEMLTFLDELRDSGEINMFGSVPYLQAEFPELSHKEAVAVFHRWACTFSERHAEEAESNANS